MPEDLGGKRQGDPLIPILHRSGIYADMVKSQGF
jgi:hypothetical protein